MIYFLGDLGTCVTHLPTHSLTHSPLHFDDFNCYLSRKTPQKLSSKALAQNVLVAKSPEQIPLTIWIVDNSSSVSFLPKRFDKKSAVFGDLRYFKISLCISCASYAVHDKIPKDDVRRREAFETNRPQTRFGEFHTLDEVEGNDSVSCKTGGTTTSADQVRSIESPQLEIWYGIHRQGWDHHRMVHRHH